LSIRFQTDWLRVHSSSARTGREKPSNATRASAVVNVAPAGNARRLAEQFARLYGLDTQPNEEEALADGRRLRWRTGRDRARIELREITGIGHAWSGGSLRGSYTAPSGPSFSDAIFRFFLQEEAEVMQRCG